MLHHLPLARKERNIMSSPSRTAFSEVLQSPSEEPVEEEVEPAPAYSTATLLTVQAAVCFLSNGALPSIQSYSCLPYGNTIYHLAVTLNAMANPLMAFLAFFLPCKRQTVVLSLAVLGGILSSFILGTALASPDMVGGVTTGGSLVVLTWVVTGALFSYVKVSVAGMCPEAGSAGGALIMFILVNQVGQRHLTNSGHFHF